MTHNRVSTYFPVWLRTAFQNLQNDDRMYIMWYLQPQINVLLECKRTLRLTVESAIMQMLGVSNSWRRRFSYVCRWCCTHAGSCFSDAVSERLLWPLLYNTEIGKYHFFLPVSASSWTFIKSEVNGGLPWWSSGWDSAFPVQGSQVLSLVGDLDLACCN